MSSSENESINSTESESDQEGIEEMDNLLQDLAPYQFEPEETSDENESSESEDDSDEDEEEDIQEERRGNTNWCKCSSCKRELRGIDSLCCTEVAAINEEKFEGKKCITEAEEFGLLCCNKAVLKNVLVGLHETRGDPLEKDSEIKNRSLRFAAYKQFIWWIFQQLGKGNRRVIPSCVVWHIRKRFPEADGQYVRFKEGERD